MSPNLELSVERNMRLIKAKTRRYGGGMHEGNDYAGSGGIVRGPVFRIIFVLPAFFDALGRCGGRVAAGGLSR